MSFIDLDFAKAFGRVDYQLLLKKLSNFGVCGNLLSWFHNYLSDRQQKVSILGKTSRSIPVLSGVPQGSILGPLLFLVYVNDLPEKSTTSSVALFADDTKSLCLLMTQRTTDDVKSLQCNLDGIRQWCRTWRMNLSETKCGVLKVTRNLKPEESETDLGVLINADLKWNQQVSAVCAKANRMLGFVKRYSIKITILVHVPHFIKRYYEVVSRTAPKSGPHSLCLYSSKSRRFKDVQRD
ncbi:Hypothetical predicted protein [Paramuricea clavata]|uniref:Uncharacterized protein n=1 Tax=Paramuricea clavata TaxID=317549 RepID=A0A7D9M926_PARCT|nr:Hypothetical predicted protein [Paramuricea clavata]